MLYASYPPLSGLCLLCDRAAARKHGYHAKSHRASNDGCREHIDRREQAVEGVPANLLAAYSEKAPEGEPPPSRLYLL